MVVLVLYTKKFIRNFSLLRYFPFSRIQGICSSTPGLRRGLKDWLSLNLYYL